ncbi:hypothetical protein [Flavobacterium sp. XN-5]|nr:hypothetical protein [Flavobacterium sp. XN-5]
MVYAVLTDKYTTTKTFKDWYEDHSMDTLDDSRLTFKERTTTDFD